tara:strand:- start:4377 stop:4775 length:399 start_codon:yes stop_codon:yes gene_type:complete
VPSYKTAGSAGMDIRANLTEPIILGPNQRKAVSTGLFLELPDNYEIQVRPRSGLALKNGISVLNSPGTIDSDYRGEISVILINCSNEDFVIKDGDRIAQIVLSKFETIEWSEVNTIKPTDRGSGGFGSTGRN